MKSNKELFTLSRLAAAVLATCMAPSLSFAQEESADALTRPTSTIEVGIGAPSQSSAKFGEYNGLNKADGGIVGNANIRGGDAYGMGTGTQRWEIKASDLGTTSREVGASYSDQGQWNIGLNYDELRHNLSDSYQTPYVGAAGSNNFTLPGAPWTMATWALPSVGSILATMSPTTPADLISSTFTKAARPA